MSVRAIHDVFLAEGNINEERFEFFIRNYLLPVLMPFNGINPMSVVIMDNASIHHVSSTYNSSRALVRRYYSYHHILPI